MARPETRAGVPAEPAHRAARLPRRPRPPRPRRRGCASKLIAQHVEHRALEDLAIPLHVVAVDVISGQELRLSHGSVVDAVLASAAIPGVVAPIRWEDRTLMDGGVANNTPISHAVSLGAERIYVLPTGHACALREPPRGALALALHAISLLTQRRLVDDIQRHERDARLIVLPPPWAATFGRAPR